LVGKLGDPADSASVLATPPGHRPEPTFPPAPDWRTTEALDAAALFALSEGHSTS
jgi:hypothetical protein